MRTKGTLKSDKEMNLSFKRCELFSCKIDVRNTDTVFLKTLNKSIQRKLME